MGKDKFTALTRIGLPLTSYKPPQTTFFLLPSSLLALPPQPQLTGTWLHTTEPQEQWGESILGPSFLPSFSPPTMKLLFPAALRDLDTETGGDRKK